MLSNIFRSSFYVLHIDLGEGSLVSQYKTTGQSTSYTCQANEQCGSGAGVDGIKGPKNMFHTHSELEPFWWVNLGEVYEIQKVISTNRINCCGEFKCHDLISACTLISVFFNYIYCKSNKNVIHSAHSEHFSWLTFRKNHQIDKQEKKGNLNFLDIFMLTVNLKMNL